MRKMTITALAAAVSTAGAANAQQACADRDQITTRLESKYGESFAGGGLRNAKSIYEVWMSEDSGTWTIIMTKPDGQACVMAAGTNWRKALPAQPAGIPG